MSYQPSFCESSLEGLGDTKAVSFSKQLFATKKDRRALKVAPYPSNLQPNSPPPPSIRSRFQVLIFSELTESLNDLIVLSFSLVTLLDYSLLTTLRDYHATIHTLWLMLLVLMTLRDIAHICVVKPRLFLRTCRAVDVVLTWCLMGLLVVMLRYGRTEDESEGWVVVVRIGCMLLSLRKVRDMKAVLIWPWKKPTSKHFSVSTSADKVHEILQKLLSQPWLQFDSPLTRDLQWCSQVIASNTLDQPLVVMNNNVNSPAREHELVSLVNQFSHFATPAAGHVVRRSGSQTMFDGREFVNSPMTEAVKVCLREVNTCEFDIFAFKQATENNELFVLVLYLFRKEELMTELTIDTRRLTNYISRVQAGYNATVLYHNSTHAADVTQTMYYFLSTCEAGRKTGLSYTEIAACYLAAAVHDFEHPGLTNGFLVATQADIALRYNDRSVLENHHISASFSISLDENCDLFADLQPNDYTHMRELMIAMVLGTDSTNHFAMLSQFKATVESDGLAKTDTRLQTLSVLLHAADISNPAKPWSLCHHWADLVLNEFWLQGDRERKLGLPLSYLCDRYSVSAARSQVGFIDVVVAPLFATLQRAFEDIETNCRYLEKNRALWAQEDLERKTFDQ